jgi:Zn-finger nucleic acid-binding protein
MDSKTLEVIQLELKYCERCGGLWLRRQGVADVYCMACAGEMPEFSGRRKSKPRLPRNPGLDVHGQLPVMFCREGGNA